MRREIEIAVYARKIQGTHVVRHVRILSDSNPWCPSRLEEFLSIEGARLDRFAEHLNRIGFWKISIKETWDLCNNGRNYVKREGNP